MSNKNDNDNLIKLYDGLVTQIYQYKSTIWQIPIAIVALNFISFYHLNDNTSALIFLIIFDVGVIYTFHRFIAHQDILIQTTRLISDKLKNEYPDYIPTMRDEKLKPALFMKVVLIIMVLLLIFHAICNICK